MNSEWVSLVESDLTEKGWYPVIRVWDGLEGHCVDASYFNGKYFEDDSHMCSIIKRAFKTKAEAQTYAELSDPDFECV